MNEENEAEPAHSDQPATGSNDYRAFVGFPEKYDLVAAMQFNLLTTLGLRDSHQMLDIGCGSLRLGRLLIPYLRAGGYCGLEPNQWLVDEGLSQELGKDIVNVKQPQFVNRDDYDMAEFDRKFDYMVAQSIFSHTPESQIRQCFAQVAKHLAPEGRFAATFMQGESNYTGDDWVYPGCVDFTLAHLQGVAAEYELCLRPLDWYHPNMQTWTLITHKAFQPDIPEAGGLARIAQLEQTVNALEDKFRRLEQHPYVRVGMGLRKRVRQITGR